MTDAPPIPDPFGDDHANHWATHPVTGERVEEASIVVDGQRIYWCGHTEPADCGDMTTRPTPPPPGPRLPNPGSQDENSRPPDDPPSPATRINEHFEMHEVTEPVIYLYRDGQQIIDEYGQPKRFHSVEEARHCAENWIY